MVLSKRSRKSEPNHLSNYFWQRMATLTRSEDYRLRVPRFCFHKGRLLTDIRFLNQISTNSITNLYPITLPHVTYLVLITYDRTTRTNSPTQFLLRLKIASFQIRNIVHPLSPSQVHQQFSYFLVPTSFHPIKWNRLRIAVAKTNQTDV